MKTGARRLFAGELLATRIAPRPARNVRSSAIISRASTYFAKWRTARQAARLQRIDRVIEKGLSAIE